MTSVLITIRRLNKNGLKIEPDYHFENHPELDGTGPHWTALDRMEKAYPSVDVNREVKFVDEGHLITSAGISAGIEMALHVVAVLYGIETAAHTAKHMEYDWQTGY